MYDAFFIKQGLHLQGLPQYQQDIPYIQDILNTIKLAETSLNAFHHLQAEVPITVVDRRIVL